MTKHVELGEMVKKALAGAFSLVKNDIGSDAKLSAKGTTMETESYEISGFGHFCILRMHAMMGLMKMETAILAPFEKELPLMNLDWVQAMGKETQIIEYYDDREADFERTLMQSFKDSGKGKTEAFHRKVSAELEAFLEKTVAAQPADPAKKAERVRRFAENLFASDGPAVHQVVKLFGEKTAHRLVVKHMYGIWDFTD